MYDKGALSVVVLVAALGLGGCWESTDVTVHNPGQYKGPADPLLQQDAAAREQTLRERFELVQLDR